MADHPLKRYRREHNLTRNALARRLAVANGRTVMRYETGDRFPVPEVLERIVEATGGEVTVAALWDAYRKLKAG